MSTQRKSQKELPLSNGEKIGKYTKYQREKRGQSLRTFALHCDLTPSFLSRLEQGSYQGVSIDVIEKLSKGFSMEIVELLRKCKVASYRKRIWSLEYYLKEKYQLPRKAIRECESFIEFLCEKYSKDIKVLQSKHEEYWKDDEGVSDQ